MKLLLDTQCWLWMQASPDRLADEAREMLADGGVELALSAASSWEIAIKYALGKLLLPEPPGRYVPRRLRDDGIEPLAVTHIHALRVAELPQLHRDPFDRLLIAQAQCERLPLLTADRLLAGYEVETIWAARTPLG
jgi:PIN domain nuclease of toxin-antitoxin system